MGNGEKDGKSNKYLHKIRKIELYIMCTQKRAHEWEKGMHAKKAAGRNRRMRCTEGQFVI